MIIFNNTVSKNVYIIDILIIVSCHHYMKPLLEPIKWHHIVDMAPFYETEKMNGIMELTYGWARWDFKDGC